MPRRFGRAAGLYGNEHGRVVREATPTANALQVRLLIGVSHTLRLSQNTILSRIRKCVHQSYHRVELAVKTAHVREPTCSTDGCRISADRV